jgi:hypothetical protein
MADRECPGDGTCPRQWLPFRWRPGESFLMPCANACPNGISERKEFIRLDVGPEKRDADGKLTGELPDFVQTSFVRLLVDKGRQSVRYAWIDAATGV